MTKTSIYKTGWIVLDDTIRSLPAVKSRVDDLLEFGGTMHMADHAR